MRKIRSRLSLVLAAFLAFLPSVGAQEQASGQITWAKGTEVSIQSGKNFRSFQIGKDAVIGQSVIQGDLVQTGPGSVIEIKFSPSGNILKIAENSSVRITDLVEGKGTMEVLYGRVRSKVAKLSGTDSYSVKSATAVAGVRGTDFGFDVMVVPGGGRLPRSQVYSFEGEVAVTAAKAKPGEEVIIKGGQFVAIIPADAAPAAQGGEQSVPSGDQVLIVSPTIPATLQQYWQERDTGATSADTTPAAGIAAGSADKDAGSAIKGGNVADSLPPLPEFSATAVMSKDQYVYGPDWKKQTGMTIAGSGLGLGLVGALLGAWGYEIFGIPADQARLLGQVSLVGGITLTLSGSSLFVWGLLER